MKKLYQNPKTSAVEVAPRAVLCSSPGGFMSPNLEYGGSQGGFGGA